VLNGKKGNTIENYPSKSRIVPEPSFNEQIVLPDSPHHFTLIESPVQTEKPEIMQ